MAYTTIKLIFLKHRDLRGAARTADLNKIRAIGYERGRVPMVGAVKAVCASVLKVGAKGDGVGRRPIRGKPNDQDVASSRNRRSVNRG